MDDRNSGLYERLKRLDTLDKENMMQELRAIHIPKLKKTLGQKFAENIKSGIVVGMVNLPMCISFAVASGTTPNIGVMSGIWGGIFGGLIGGSYYNVLGPAGAMAGFLAKFVSQWGPDALPWGAFIGGAFAILLMLFNLGKYIDMLPLSVNEGFTLGIAFSIFFGQMSNALGMPPLPKSGSGHEEETVIDFIGKNLYNIDKMNSNAFGIFILFFLFLFIMTKFLPKIPWIVVVNILGIVIGVLDSYEIFAFNLITLQKKFGELKLILFKLPTIPAEHPFMLINPKFYVDCLPVAFALSLECLITGKIADTVTNTKFNIQRELKALSIVNLIIGGIGGMPSTGSLPRTALNIRSGATHKYSSLISSVVLLIMGLVFLPLFKFLPLPVIASQMCFIAGRMVNFSEVKDMFSHDRKNFWLFVFVFVLSVVTDPIIGVFLGLLIYQLLFSEMLLNPYSEVIMTRDMVVEGQHRKNNLKEHFMDIPEKEGKYVIYRFVGVINFMNIDIHKERILSLAKNDDSTICLSMRYMNITDVNALEALKALIDEIENNNVTRKLPKRAAKEFMEDGEIIKVEIEESHSEMKENNYLGRKIIITGLSQSKYNKFKDSEWFKHLRNKGQLLLTDDIKLDISSNYDRF